MIVRSHHRIRPRAGELRSGDAVVVRARGGRNLLAVIDALGHGDQAAAAADVARETLETIPLETPVVGMQEELHRALAGTRGAAAMLLLVADGVLEGCGVGNVEVRSHPGGVPAILSPGILGSFVRRFRPFRTTVEAGTRLFVMSDGISLSRFSADAFASMDVVEACGGILEGHGRDHDDAAILVADVKG